ncbi:MAG TPA: carboxypeptidase-like regulatory domain-containing protein, partial [Candidatus Acidoferrum sp.]|nr:carboxypeptidase-like regulatory domain-containing protein [Candidatus Acidoferrum sp.]
MKPARFLGFLPLLAACATLPASLFAQYPLGTLRGTVQDSSGARIAGAGISASNSEKSLIRAVRSDARGEFQVEQIPPGSYLVTVSAGGFTA